MDNPSKIGETDMFCLTGKDQKFVAIASKKCDKNKAYLVVDGLTFP